MNSLDFSAHSYAGAAVPATLASAIDSITTTITLGSTTNWIEVNTGSPLGTSGAYIIALDYGTATEEKVLVPHGQTGTTLNGVTRAYDGTAAASHSNLTLPVVPVFSASEAAEANVAVQAVANLNGRGTNPTPEDVFLGGAGSGQPGFSQYAAAADHAHAITTATINSALDAGTIQGLQQKPYAWAANASNTTATNISPVYPSVGFDPSVCAQVSSVTNYATYLVTVTANLHNTGSGVANPWIGFGLSGSFQDSYQVTGIPAGAVVPMTAQFVYVGTPTDVNTFSVLVARASSSNTLTIYGSSISVVGLQ